MTGQVIDRLPAHYRAADSAGILATYLDLLGVQITEIDQLVARFAYTVDNETQSDLTDPDTADDTWLRWLAQLAGVDTTYLPAPAQIRSRLRTGFLDVGSLGALDRQLADYLPAGSYTIVKHYEGNPWIVAIVTDVGALGLTTWQSLEADFPTWDSIDGLTWDDLGPSMDLLERPEIEALRPAGIRFVLELVGDPGTWLVLSLEAPTWADVEALGDWDGIEELELTP